MSPSLTRKIGAVVSSFFAVLTALFALGLPATTAPFIAMAFFMCIVPLAVEFVIWIEGQLEL